MEISAFINSNSGFKRGAYQNKTKNARSSTNFCSQNQPTYRTAALSLLPPEIIDHTLAGVKAHATIIEGPARAQITQAEFPHTGILRRGESGCVAL